MSDSSRAGDSPKSAETKHALAVCFLNLLRTRPVNEITVQDVVNNCGVKRNTFYYHFHSLSELIDYIAVETVDDLIDQHPPRIHSLEECFLAAIDFARQNSQIIRNLYHFTNRANFERHLWRVCDYIISAYLASGPREFVFPESQTDREAMKDLLKFELFGFAIDYLNRGMPMDVEEKVRNVSTLFGHLSKNVH